MNSTNKKPHTEAELISIFKNQGISKSLVPRLLKKYNVCFAELYEDMKNYDDDSFEDGDSVQASALYVLNLYTKPFIELIKKGHSEEWAHLVANNLEDDEIKIYDAYETLKKENKELAQKELLLHCNNLSEDEDFRRHYLYLFKIGEGFNKPNEIAKVYAKDYKEQLEKGKSKLFAHEYADLADSDYHDIYRGEYAYAFEKGIIDSKNEVYSRVFADKYASALVDIKRRYEISEDEEAIDFAIEKVNAYMKAWEYATENKLKVTERFYEIYESIHLNTYYADDGMPDETLEEIDKEILDKVLMKYKK